MEIKGVWLPIITPFFQEEVDYDSYEKLIEYYISKKIHGIIPLATTGESPTIKDYEFEKVIEKTIEIVKNRIPIFIGAGGNDTETVIKKIKIVEKYDIQGILTVSPYYNRPDQRGILAHFKKISENTQLKMIVYNIPYRTGRNIENNTIYKLAELKNIIGLKDSCGDIKQSMELLLNKPKDFSVLTGEDLLYYLTLSLGGDGGILASAHVNTEQFIEIYEDMKNNNHKKALENWRKIFEIIPLLFEEPNPAPIKYILYTQKMIKSLETRLPLVEISDKMKEKIDKVFV